MQLGEPNVSNCDTGELLLSQAEFCAITAALRRSAAAALPGFPKCALGLAPEAATALGCASKASEPSKSPSGQCVGKRRLCASPTEGIPVRRSARTLARRSAGGELFVTLADAERLKSAAVELYLSKRTFLPEKHLLRPRVFHGVHFRTYVLVDGHLRRESEKHDESCCYLGALTLRLNSYRSKQTTRWAQILNMCTRFERRGHGMRLFREVERLVSACDDVDVLVCYPADDGAALFWKACGFSERHRSLLPDDDLLPTNEGGNLIPEVRGGDGADLARWEKAVSRPMQH